ncbi:MAG: AI-2E family transporter [Actinophytocola sp.]|nr:AI-2E family transporter [Actinophytocola sp.]
MTDNDARSAEPESPAPAGDSAPATPQDTDVTSLVPVGLRLSAAFAWRLLIIAAAIGVVLWLVGRLALVTTTLAVALLLAALMAPAVDVLIRKVALPRGLAVAATIVGGLALLGGLVTFVVVQFTHGLPALRTQLNRSLDQVERWLTEGPFGLESANLNNLIGQLVNYIQENQGTITTSALTTAGVVGEFLTGILLTLFILIFFLLHGREIWSFVVKAVPGQARQQADIAGRRGFASLVSYVRATAIVAVVDAVGIGVGLWILGVPLVVPLSTLVFLGAFIPIVGAVVTGTVAVLVTLVTVGWVQALIALAVVIAVMQLESHVLQPLLLGRAVKIHPLAVILAITVGLVIAGITGALVSVPLVAVINAGAKSLIDDEAQSGDEVPMFARSGSSPEVVNGAEDGE